MDFKETCRKIWCFLWESDSIWSWLANILLAFVLIKFIVYPGLGFFFGTAYPVVAVVSGSMEHDGSFEEWWNTAALCGNKYCTQKEWYALYSISKEKFKEYSFNNGFNKGDIMVLYGTEPKNIKMGDVIVFVNKENGDPIIHRVIVISTTETGYVYTTKGDHNNDSGAIDKSIAEDAVIGKAVVRIPLLGWIKIIFVQLIQTIVSAIS